MTLNGDFDALLDDADSGKEERRDLRSCLASPTFL